MPRRQANCPLCDQPTEFNHRLWRLFVQHNAESVARWASVQLKKPITHSQATRHLSYHRPEQAPPQGRLRREEAEIKRRKLPDRCLSVLQAVARHSVLAESQVRDLIYLGNYNNDNAVQAACYRDLKKLVHDDFLYRAYPSFGQSFSLVPGKERRNLGTLSLGRESIPFIERTEEFTPKVITGREDINWERVEAHLQRAEIMTLLRKSLLDNPPASNVQLTTDNWYGERQLEWWFNHPLTNEKLTVGVDGLNTLEVNMKGRAVLLPFFYLYDRGWELPEKIIERVIRWQALTASSVFRTRIPALGRNMIPPLLIVTAEPERIYELRRAVNLRKKEWQTLNLPMILVGDRRSLRMGGWESEYWTSLWAEGDNPTWRNLWQSMLLAYKDELKNEGRLLPAGSKLKLDLTQGIVPRGRKKN